jgi:glycosyltransferase involved in cell wall biosynthesis
MTVISFLRTDMGYQTGATTATLELANALVSKGGYQAHIFSMYGDTATLSKAGIEVNPLIQYHNLNPGAHRIREGFFRTVQAYRRYLREYQVDVACSVCLSPMLTTMFATRSLPVKTVLIEHSNRKNSVDYDVKSLVMGRVAIPKFDAIVTLTQADRSMYLEKYRVQSPQVHVIPNWMYGRILDAAASANLSSKAIITVGNLNPVKGYDLLVQVAAKLKQRFPSWKWDIYGDGPERDRLEALIDESDLRGFLNLKGNDLGVVSRYKEYALFAMTSRFEGFPLALLESRTNNLPAVAFDCPFGPREMIRDGIDGFLVPCYDTSMMAERLADLMTDVELRKQMARAVPASIEAFSEERVLPLWTTLFEELIGRT